MKRFVGARALVAASLLAFVCFAISAAGAGAAAPTGTKVLAAKPLIPHGAKALGAVSPTASVSGAVVLQPRDPDGLTRFIAQVTDKHSPLFHHYLTPSSFAERFGATPSTIEAVKSQLQASGLSVTSVARDGLIVHFQAPASHVETAFRTSLERYRLANGSIGQARTAPVRVPGTIAKDVTAVVGLDTTVRLRSSGVLHAAKSARGTYPAAKTAGSFTHPAGSPTPCADATAAAEGFGGLTDDQIANAYGVFGLYGAGDIGAGQHIAVFELEPFAMSDLQTFDTCYFGSTQAAAMLGRVHIVNVDGGQPAGPGSGEAILDIQDVSAFAPGANIDVYQAPNTTFGALDEYAKIVNDNVDKIVTSSWGLCEQAVQQGSPGIQQAENIIFQQAAAQGQTVFSAAGDAGSNDCNAFLTTSPVSPILSVDDPSSQPYVVATGGTTIDNATQPASEHVWNDGAAWGAGGGGISEAWPMPDLAARFEGARRERSERRLGRERLRGGRPRRSGLRVLRVGQPGRRGRGRLPPAARRQRRRRRVHRRHHRLHRAVRRLEHVRRHLVGGPAVGGDARGGQRLGHLQEQPGDAERGRLPQPAPLLRGVESDRLRGVVQRHQGGEQRRVRRLEPVPRHERLRHGLGSRHAAADPAGRRGRPRVLSLQPGTRRHAAHRHTAVAFHRLHVGPEHERDDHRLALPGRHEPRRRRPGRRLPGPRR